MNIRVIQKPIFLEEIYLSNNEYLVAIINYIPPEINSEKSKIFYTSICHIFETNYGQYMTEYYNQNVEGLSFNFDFNNGELRYTKNSKFQKFVVYYHYLSFSNLIYSAGQIEYLV